MQSGSTIRGSKTQEISIAGMFGNLLHAGFKAALGGKGRIFPATHHRNLPRHVLAHRLDGHHQGGEQITYTRALPAIFEIVQQESFRRRKGDAQNQRVADADLLHYLLRVDIPAAMIASLADQEQHSAVVFRSVFQQLHRKPHVVEDDGYDVARTHALQLMAETVTVFGERHHQLWLGIETHERRFARSISQKKIDQERQPIDLFEL